MLEAWVRAFKISSFIHILFNFISIQVQLNTKKTETKNVSAEFPLKNFCYKNFKFENSDRVLYSGILQSSKLKSVCELSDSRRKYIFPNK